jgi:ATP-binding cassette subfamily G (WHITE) protein 2 (SNQ2)
MAASDSAVEKLSLDRETNVVDHQDAGYEAGREQVRQANVNGLTKTQSGVDVAQAERDFVELSKQLSGISGHARRLSKQNSRPSKPGKIDDIEKVGSTTDSDEEPWQLETTLHGSKAAESQAGIKPKHIGKPETMYHFRGERWGD